MSGKQHLTIAIGCALPTANIVIILGAVIGSLIPDIDTPHSIINKCVNIYYLTLGTMKHRGMTHTVLASVIVSCISYAIFHNLDFTMGLFIGYLSHLISDMLTASGIRILYPFSKKRYRLFHPLLSSEEFRWLVCVVVLACGFYLFKHL